MMSLTSISFSFTYVWIGSPWSGVTSTKQSPALSASPLDPQQHGPAVVELHGRRRRLGPGGELDGTEVDLGGQTS